MQMAWCPKVVRTLLTEYISSSKEASFSMMAKFNGGADRCKIVAVKVIERIPRKNGVEKQQKNHGFKQINLFEEAA